MKKSMIGILVLIGLVIYGGYDYLSKSSSETGQAAGANLANLEVGIERGQLAPDFTLSDLSGMPVQLSDFAGKKVLLNFWATWCPPCRIEMPHMQKIYEDYEAKDVVILGVNLTPTEENPDLVETFVDDQQLTFPILMDQFGDVMQTFQIIAYPTTYILDSDGVVREKYRGAINYEIMEDAISKIN
ncbi:TlpA family protein disulfide reductase [Paenibacillaceae bacterium]|nr:TlpA family protein disulfide reductase [Paenibacillaceae bacterium]